MKLCLRAALTLIFLSCSGCITQPDWVCDDNTTDGITLKEAAQREQGLNVKVEALWQIKKIRVCWEKNTFADTAAEDRATVQRAIDETWNTALDRPELEEKDRVRFVGWQSCDDDADAAQNGVRIKVGDWYVFTQALGKHLAGNGNGMQLNFTFKNWGKECALDVIRKSCIYATAVHEFGHALGLAHEQNRTDTPDTCNDRQGTDGNIYLGEWDEQSVMNYCNPNWNNGGKLSSTDTSGIIALYYPELSHYYCKAPAK